MIPVACKPEPESFQAKVREPGQKVLDKLARRDAEAVAQGKPKPKRDPAKDYKPYWRDCLDDLYESYGGICAYMAQRIHRSTGSKTVEHMRPKKEYPELVYEWSNYRLVCGTMNGRKSAAETVLDPTQIREGWFQLDMSLLTVKANADLADDIRTKVELTIETLKLNDYECRMARAEYYEPFLRRGLDEDQLLHWAPFMAGEFRRQGLKREIELPRWTPPVKEVLGRKPRRPAR